MVLHDILRAPIEWSNMVAGSVHHVSDLQSPDWVLRAYGPTLAAGSLVSALKKGAQVDATLDSTFASTTPDQQGLTANEPIAIVGMAGRFPEATSHEELWKLLEAGIDTVKVVRHLSECHRSKTATNLHLDSLGPIRPRVICCQRWKGKKRCRFPIRVFYKGTRTVRRSLFQYVPTGSRAD